MKSDTQSILKQFDPIEALFADVRRSIQQNEYGAWVDEGIGKRFYAICLSCISRIAGLDSTYGQLANDTISNKHNGYLGNCEGLFGVMMGLKQDVDAGYLSTLRELVHADLFADFLEAADYLLEESHKDPAAVMIGGVLEEHLRQLCIKSGLDVETPDSRQPSKLVPLKADSLNNELARASVYGKLEQKQVLAWLDLRNKAAHGKYSEYDEAQVALFLQGVRNFISKYPA